MCRRAEAALAADVERKIRGINRSAAVQRATRCDVALDTVLDRHACDLNRMLELEPDFLGTGHDHHHSEDVTSVSLRLSQPLDPGRFLYWLEMLLATQGQDILRTKGVISPEINAALIAGTVLKRAGRPEEIAYAAVFLASDEASYVTGTSLVVDGGYLAP